MCGATNGVAGTMWHLRPIMVWILYESFLQGDKSQLLQYGLHNVQQRQSVTWMLPLSLRAMQC